MMKVSGNSLLKYPLLFILPAFAIYFIFALFPLLSGMYYGFTDWNLYNKTINFNGLENFKLLFKEGADLTLILKNTFYFAISTVVLQNILAFLLALLMTQKLMIRNWARTILFLPCILTPLVVGYSFTAILSTDGLFNGFLTSIGLSEWAVGWLGEPSKAMTALILINIWQWTGFSMAIYIAGLQNIPQELIESAKVEGANGFQRIYHIVIPLIGPSITVNIILSMIGALKAFDLIYVTTSGGPGSATEVFLTYIYKQLAAGRLGYGVAANIVLFLIILLLTLIILPILRKREVQH
jgi:raffinose/stachyose/melibiose transport system permease protein